MSSVDSTRLALGYMATFSSGINGTVFSQYFAPSTSAGRYATETDARCILPKCVVGKLWVNVHASTMASVVFTLMKNGVPTSLAVSYGASETGIKSASFDVPFEKGDAYSIRIAWNYGGGSPKSLGWTGGGLSYGNG